MTLFEISPEAREQGLCDVSITGVTDSTAELKEGNIFVCIIGAHFDGHGAAAEMLEKGAAAVVVERDLGLQRQIIIPNTRSYFSRLASNFFGNPTKRLKLIAATGTNGKSTTISIIKAILEGNGHKTGSIGTVGYDVCGKVYEATLTTPRQMALYGYFREMADNGAEYCVIEASSQALAQFRFDEECFEASVFTNLTQDHLDYHKTMDAYFKAKARLFEMSKCAIVNIDDKYGERLLKKLKIPVKTYSVKDTADFYAVNVKSGNGGVAYWLSCTESEKSFPVKLPLPGVFNVANSLAAVAACVSLGFSPNDCVKALSEYKGVSGRSEVIYDGEFTVLCDYAHTEDALRKFLTAVKGFASHRIICVFGAAGERDAEKRPAMGKTVGELADYAVVTSDNPRFENAQSIINEVLKGITETGIRYSAFVDRRRAIEHALNVAEKGDIVALCGKGHEKYQVIGDEYRKFVERDIVNEIMKERNKA